MCDFSENANMCDESQIFTSHFSAYSGSFSQSFENPDKNSNFQDTIFDPLYILSSIRKLYNLCVTYLKKIKQIIEMYIKFGKSQRTSLKHLWIIYSIMQKTWISKFWRGCWKCCKMIEINQTDLILDVNYYFDSEFQMLPACPLRVFRQCATEHHFSKTNVV